MSQELSYYYATSLSSRNQPTGESSPNRAGPHQLRAALVMRRYLLTCLALAALAPVEHAAAQTVAEVQVTPETMTLGVERIIKDKVPGVNQVVAV